MRTQGVCCIVVEVCVLVTLVYIFSCPLPLKKGGAEKKQQKVGQNVPPCLTHFGLDPVVKRSREKKFLPPAHTKKALSVSPQALWLLAAHVNSGPDSL